MLLAEVALDVRPELDELCPEGALSRYGECADGGLLEAALFRGVVEVRDGAGDEVAGDVGVVRSPLAIVAAAPDGGAGRVEEAAGGGAGAEGGGARGFLEHDRQHGVAPEVAVECVGVGGCEASEVALRALAPAPSLLGDGAIRVALVLGAGV